MKRTLNISFVLFFAVCVSSCAKEELEDPSQIPAPQAIIMEADMQIDHNNIASEMDDDRLTPLHINDDGDEEDEGLKPTILIENK